METKKINVLIKPSPTNNRNNENSLVTLKDLTTSIEVNSNVLLKDICKVVLEKFGLGHLSHKSEAFIDVAGSQHINCETFYPDKQINVDILQYLLGSSFSIIVYARGEFRDFIEMSESKAAIVNLLDHILKNYSFVKDFIPSQVVRDFVDSYMNGSIDNLSHETLAAVNKELERLKDTRLCKTDEYQQPSNNNLEDTKNIGSSLLKEFNFKNVNVGRDKLFVESKPTPRQLRDIKKGIDDSKKSSMVEPKTENRRGKGRIRSYNMTNSITTPKNVHFNNFDSTPYNQSSFENQKDQTTYKTPLSRLSNIGGESLSVSQSNKGIFNSAKSYDKKKHQATAEFLNYAKGLSTYTRRSRYYRLTPAQVGRMVRERLILSNGRNKFLRQHLCEEPNITL